MRAVHRLRHYASPHSLALMRPLFRYSDSREAYVLRLVGNHVGPVFRPDRRRDQSTYSGPDRRHIEPNRH